MLNAKTAAKLTLLIALAGCAVACDEQVGFRPRAASEPTAAASKTAPAKDPSYLTRETVEEAADQPGEGAVTKAMFYAQRNAELANELLAAHQRVTEMEREIRRLNTELATSNATLSAAQNELADANTMIEEMKHDLAEWRREVLGVRKDMADAMAAQLRASQQILQYLGADVSKPGPQANAMGKKH